MAWTAWRKTVDIEPVPGFEIDWVQFAYEDVEKLTLLSLRGVTASHSVSLMHDVLIRSSSGDVISYPAIGFVSRPGYTVGVYHLLIQNSRWENRVAQGASVSLPYLDLGFVPHSVTLEVPQ